MTTILHTESTMSDLCKLQGCTITSATTYTLPTGETRYYDIAGQSRCGIDGIMNHIVVSREPITESDKSKALRDWNNGR